MAQEIVNTVIYDASCEWSCRAFRKAVIECLKTGFYCGMSNEKR